jgi:hypothetical protein
VFQADLLDVLDEFAVKVPIDFYKLPPGKKTYFIRRLYKAFADNEDEAMNDLLSAGGVKLHFATSGDLTVANTNLPSAVAFPDKKKEFRRLNKRLISANFKLQELNRQFMENELSDSTGFRFEGETC